MGKRIFHTKQNMQSSAYPLPAGTVTFLFTDIVGSTALWERKPEKMTAALQIHNTALREAVDSHGGIVFKVIGDAIQSVFPTALQALEAAIQGQRLLQSAAWNDLGPLAVRMGLHTGEAEPDPDGDEYAVSHTKNRAARIMSAGHGEQILMSMETANLVDHQLPGDTYLKDLGKHSLKGMVNPEHLYQVCAPGLQLVFPPLDTAVTRLQNLPLQLTSFIGREKEIEELSELLGTSRLVTLTGAGGTGKTRLALQVAARMIENFHDGVVFVALAPITDRGLVITAIAQPFGISESARQPLVDSLVDYLRDKELLLLLDNFEQVMSATPFIIQLLANCGKVKVLITSRERLRISVEREYPISPLALPDPAKLPALETVSQYAAVQLFIQRAQAVKPGFRITEDTAQTVAKICFQLDGLPLAIELAAARIKLMSPQAILSRLEHRLEFLTGGARDLPERQQTLRNAILWSYELLNQDEQEFFRRLSVFVGGCTIEAVESVACDDPGRFSSLDLLGSLLDKSLIHEAEGIDNEPRFLMTEILREFSLELLEASSESESIRYRHAKYFKEFAEQAVARFESAEQPQWVSLMEQEHDNLRAAFEWCKDAENAGELCLRLAGSLGLFWEARGYFSEGRDRLSALIARHADQAPTAARAKLLTRAAELAYRQSDYPATTTFAGESLAMYRQLGDRHGVAAALIKLGNAATETGDYETAKDRLEEALAIWRDLGDKHGTARALISLGWAVLRHGDYQLAYKLLQEALTISRQLGDTRSMGFELSGLGEIALRQGDYPRAKQFVEESLEMRRQLGNKWGIGVSLGMLGWIAGCQGDWHRAVAYLCESLEIRKEIGDKGGIAWCLERLAEIAMSQGGAEKAVRLFSAAATLRAAIGSVIDSTDQPELEHKVRSLRAELGDMQFEAAWKEGRALTFEQAVILAQDVNVEQLSLLIDPRDR